jgi:hypothetical protein
MISPAPKALPVRKVMLGALAPAAAGSAAMIGEATESTIRHNRAILENRFTSIVSF